MSGVELVAVTGDIDIHTRESARALLLAAVGAERPIIDLSAVAYIDSAGVTELVQAYRALTNAGARSVRFVVKPGSNPERLFELCGLNQVLEVFDSVEAARR